MHVIRLGHLRNPDTNDSTVAAKKVKQSTQQIVTEYALLLLLRQVYYPIISKTKLIL
jgi:hypothetical protein